MTEPVTGWMKWLPIVGESVAAMLSAFNAAPPARTPEEVEQERRRAVWAAITADLATLGLPADDLPTAKALKAAYRKRAVATHPDKGGTAGAFDEVKSAYDRLRTVVPGAE